MVVFVVGAGLSILAIHRYSAADCPTIMAIPGTRQLIADDQESDDPACAVGACGNAQSAHAIDPDMQAGESGGGVATPVYSGSSTPMSLRVNGGGQDELC
jgi:hypothetical protein